jgi:hypothetical protein
MLEVLVGIAVAGSVIALRERHAIGRMLRGNRGGRPARRTAPSLSGLGTPAPAHAGRSRR